MKKTTVLVLAALVCAVLVWFLITGFRPETSAFITDDFEVSADGKELSFSVGVGSSMGYVRAFRDEGGGVKPHYLNFDSAWGGLNSVLGAKSKFVLQLDPDDTEIYVYHGGKGYDLALQKDEASGEWRRYTGTEN